MPTPLGIFADMVNALAPSVGNSPLLAGYLIGLALIITIFVVVIVAFSRSDDEVSGGVFLFAAGLGITIAALVGLWDSWTVIFIGILIAWILKDRMFPSGA